MTASGAGRAIGMTALGAYAPGRVMPNSEFEALVETSDEWIRERTGIRERRVAAEGEYASHMGVRAGQDLVRRYPEALAGVDAVVCATSSPDAFFPSTAALIAGQVGLKGAAALDVSTACSGFVYALSVAHGLLAAGTARKALVVGADTMSRVLDWSDRGTCILFGDGGGAAILEEVPEGFGFQSFVLGADSSGGPSLYQLAFAPGFGGIEETGSKALRMNGREVFKFAVRVLVESGEQALAKAGLKSGDVDWLVPHQANIRILESASGRFGIPLSKTVVNLERYGNTSAASVPLALREALDDGRVQDGMQLLLIAFGGGLSWGACALRWYGGAGQPVAVQAGQQESRQGHQQEGHQQDSQEVGA